MTDFVSRRRSFLAGTGIAATAAVAGSQLATARTADQPQRRAKGTVAKAGSSNTVESPFAIVALNRLGFGPRRTQLGELPPPADPDVIFTGSFETAEGNDQAGLDDVSYFMSLGSNDAERLRNYLEEQLDPNLADDEVEARLAQYASEFTTLNQGLTPMFRARECENFEDYARPTWEAERAAFNRAIYSRRQLFELMVDFWHNHLNVFAGDDSDTYAGWAHWDRQVVRKRAFGNFYLMLLDSAQHPAMLHYLDNWRSGQDGGFNENYGRELLELHTMGAENYAGPVPPGSVPALAENPYAALNDPDIQFYEYDQIPIAEKYTDEDVYSLAKALTGWTYDSADTETQCGSGAFFIEEGWHDTGVKPFLSGDTFKIGSDGAAGPEGTLAIKLAAYHPGTAAYIARKLCRRLLADEPPQSLVDAAAATFYANRLSGKQIERTLRTIILSDEFSDPAYFNNKLKRPFEYVVSAMRAAGCDHTFRFSDGDTTRYFLSEYEDAGQQLFWWRTPDGYPDKRDHWQGSTSLVQAWSCVDWLLDRHADDPGQRVMKVLDITLANIPGRPTPREMVAFWCDWIMGFTPPGGWVGPVNTGISGTLLGQECLRFFTQQMSPNDTGTGAPWPEDFDITRAELQENEYPQYWHERLRGLVALIMGSPQFMQR